MLGFLLTTLAVVYLFLFPPASNEKVQYPLPEHPIVFENAIYSSSAQASNAGLLVPLDFVKDALRLPMTYDTASDSILFTTRHHIYQFPVAKAQYIKDGQLVETPSTVVEKHGDSLFIRPSILPEEDIPFVFTSPENSDALFIYHVEGTVANVSVEEENVDQRRLRTGTSLQNPYVAEALPGERLFLINEGPSFSEVRMPSGISGYLSNDVLTTPETTTITSAYQQEERFTPGVASEEVINMTWEAVYSANPDTTTIPPMPGVNVVSPTWFALETEAGDLSSKASTSYMNWANDRGYEVWAVVTNDFDPDKTAAALQAYSTRTHMVDQLVAFAKEYQLDGINIDFENVNEEDGPLVTQFVRELTPRLHKEGFTVSMDITFISNSGNWSAFYERDKLTSVVDYMVVMAYDEHWGSSPEAGSVSSLPWVEGHLQRLLEVVPNERLILGIPFYARIWEEQTTANGNIEVSSSAHSMDGIEAWMEERGLTSTYDDQTGQDYAEYQEEGTHYKVWMENETSLQKRVDLMHAYELAGVASWTRSLGSDEIWQVLENALNEE
ncbi:spore germination protein YaaH [Aureibacillus halotolerans]|uniref:Spore germination protein YaaH n=2 Tax=Aureibacillus halotolerans TaxID=1508390 RepID=A0A4R6U0D6_9BACI|nr:spore germination protein YaaH [Aureibacillus halotolerans]